MLDHQTACLAADVFGARFIWHHIVTTGPALKRVRRFTRGSKAALRVIKALRALETVGC